VAVKQQQQQQVQMQRAAHCMLAEPPDLQRSDSGTAAAAADT
jgi:hypothetical protein